jgi:hypothetical protein
VIKQKKRKEKTNERTTTTTTKNASNGVVRLRVTTQEEEENAEMHTQRQNKEKTVHFLIVLRVRNDARVVAVGVGAAVGTTLS